MTAVCVVTGAAGGMGSACARSMGSSVDALLLTDRDQSRLELVAEQISGESKAQVSVMAGDIADPEFACELSRRAAADGHLHSLVHTAGLSPSMADWQEILRVDLAGVARLLDAFLEHVVLGSTAVCLASIAGHLGDFDAAMDAVLDEPLAADLEARFHSAFQGEPDPGATYRLAKRGAVRLCERAAVSWGARGGRVLSLSPGLIDTEMGRLELRNNPVKVRMAELTPVHLSEPGSDGALPGRAQDVAETVAFLCSERAAFISGCDIRVDGGLIGAMNHTS